MPSFVSKNASVAYFDSSAFVKLLRLEPESGALERWTEGWPRRASCALLRVEVVRALRTAGASSGAIARARRLLSGFTLVKLDDRLLDAAADLPASRLRSLDAIHLEAARTFGADLGALLTYDVRMVEAAEALGLPVLRPA